VKGRGALSNADGRFEPLNHDPYDDGWSRDEEPAPRKTTVQVEHSRTIIAHNQSPDIPFDQSINPYRGCEHGCVYCYARPSHAYVGLSAGLDFETRLFAKTNAAQLLRTELAKSGYRCRPLALGSNTDPYQPIERRYQIMRQILEVLADCQHPLTIVTKSALIERDLDLLVPMAQNHLVQVFISITSLDRHLSRHLEPRAAAPARRLETVKHLTHAGVPVGVMVAPVIPALNDHDIERILQQAAAAGAWSAAYVMLRLPHEVKQLFREWLVQYVPRRAEHVLSLVRGMRGGYDNDPRFGHRMSGTGAVAELIEKRFAVACQRFGLNRTKQLLDQTRFRPPKDDRQQSLF